MNKKIVIFDLDGTLLNTLQDLTDSVNYVLNEFNYPPKSIDEIREFVGNGVNKLFERAIPHGQKNINFETCVKLFKFHYGKNMFNKTCPYSGIIEMLKKIKSKNCTIAVVSNKFDKAVKELCKIYFENLVDIACGENENSGIRKKPHPDIILNILNKYNYKLNEAIYVGDSEVDIQTAKNSKIDCISVSWGFKSEDFLLKNGAKIIINSPEDIFKFL